jgi:hypothetical protein
MNKLAAEALKSYTDDDEGDDSPGSGEGEGTGFDLEAELEEFGAAMDRKDYAAAAEAFRNAVQCAGK